MSGETRGALPWELDRELPEEDASDAELRARAFWDAISDDDAADGGGKCRKPDIAWEHESEGSTT